jgi:hypothetical protein
MRWLALVLAACTHVPLSAQPSALAAHAQEFTATGHARVEVAVAPEAPAWRRSAIASCARAQAAAMIGT